MASRRARAVTNVVNATRKIVRFTMVSSTKGDIDRFPSDRNKTDIQVEVWIAVHYQKICLV